MVNRISWEISGRKENEQGPLSSRYPVGVERRMLRGGTNTPSNKLPGDLRAAVVIFIPSNSLSLEKQGRICWVGSCWRKGTLEEEPEEFSCGDQLEPVV